MIKHNRPETTTSLAALFGLQNGANGVSKGASGAETMSVRHGLEKLAAEGARLCWGSEALNANRAPLELTALPRGFMLAGAVRLVHKWQPWLRTNCGAIAAHVTGSPQQFEEEPFVLFVESGPRGSARVELSVPETPINPGREELYDGFWNERSTRQDFERWGGAPVIEDDKVRTWRAVCTKRAASLGESWAILEFRWWRFQPFAEEPARSDETRTANVASLQARRGPRR